jgi:hypothetical protein
MASLVVNKQYSDPIPPSAGQLDAAFNSVETFFNVIGLGADNITDNAITTNKIEDGAISETKLVANSVTTNELGDASVTLSKFAADIALFFEPIGSIDAYAGDTAPLGYLLCDGSAVDRVVNAQLFAITGIRYGSGDGTTTFNVPDLRGYFLRGVDGSAGRDPENTSRKAMNTGGNVGDLPGSVQLDDWKYREASTSTGTESVSIFDPAFNTGSLLASGTYLGGPGNGYDPGLPFPIPQLQNTNGASKLGFESRPKNMSTIFIIKQ